MGNATLIGMDLIFQTLIPFQDSANYQLSVGTVTLLLPAELPLDFNYTLGNTQPEADGTSLMAVNIRVLEISTFLKEYRELGILPRQFTFDLFAFYHSTAVISEIDTELYHRHTEECIPLTLKSVHFCFSDGNILDYSDRIGIYALWQLSEVA